MPLIVKFISHLYNSDVSWSVVMTAISAIIEYHIIDRNTRNTIGQYPLVVTAKKAFCQTKTSDTQIPWNL